jgi:hypothetical protein
MWSSNLIEYLRTKKKVIVTLFLGIATASDVMAFFAFPSWLLVSIRYAGTLAVVVTLVYLIYELGAFYQLLRSNEAAAAITRCSRYLRFEPHGRLQYDRDLVNRLARSQWLRNHHTQWTVARVDADNGHLFLDEGSALILPGLVFSITRASNGTSCRYQVKAEDISPDETRLTPAGFQIRAADKCPDFSIDVPDANEEEVGRDFELERLLSGILGALNEK